MKQYDAYSIRVMELDTNKPSKFVKAEMELLELLINKWEQEHVTHSTMDPVQLIQHLMDVHELSRNDLLEILEIKRSALSQILSYHKGLSKNVIRKLAERFRLSQEIFNREYQLRMPGAPIHKIKKATPARKKNTALK